MRHEWMDGLRGLAVLAVVVYHADLVVGGVPPLSEANAALEPVRMPLLACLSGMLLDRSLARGPRRHLRAKAESILWPYVVWGALDTFHVLLDAAVAGERVPWEWLPMLAYDPRTYLWFLAAVFGFHVVATPLSPPARTVAAPALVLGGGLLEGDPARYCALLGWFLLGDALARELGPRFPGGLVRVAARTRWGVLATVGRSSLVYYAVHLIVMVYAVRLLDAVHVESPWLRLVLAVLAPLGTAAALVRARTHPAIDLLFRLPPLGSTVGSASDARVAAR